MNPLLITSDQAASLQGAFPAVLSTEATLERFFESRTPVARRTVVLYQPTPVPNASRMDVDMAYAILSGADFGDTRDYFQLCEDIILADNHIQGELAKRKLALLGDPRNIVPKDDKNDNDVQAAAILNQQIDNCPAFFDACSALLDSCLWPVALVEKTYRPSRQPKLAYDLADLIRVPYPLLDFSTQRLRIRDVDDYGNLLGTTQAPDPMRYIVHRGHLLTTADQRGGPMRSLVFWWLLASMDRDWWARFLDKYGAPFLVGKFDQSDDYSRVVLQNAFQVAARIGGIVVNRQTDVELKEASARGGDSFELFHRVARQEISQLIIGQAAQTHATHSTLGSSGEGTMEQVRSDLRLFDALRLADTIKHQLFDPFLRLNRLPGTALVRWGAEEVEDTAKTAAALADLSQAGVELTDDGIEQLGELFGLSFQRAAPPPAPMLPQFGGRPGAKPPKLLPLSAPVPDLTSLAHQIDAANAQIAREGSASLARRFGEALGPLHVLVMTSQSAEDLETRLALFAAHYPTERVQVLIEDALTAFTAQGAGTAR